MTSAAVPISRLASLAPGLAAGDQLSSSCGPSIAVAYVLAAAAALAAIVCASRIRMSPRGRSSRGVRSAGWTAACAVATAAAVWSTQLAGSLSCPHDSTALFDLRRVLLSALVVPLATGAGLTIVAASPASSRRLVLGGVLCGAGWSLASFMTITALCTPGTVDYDFLLVALSVAMNVGTATVFCWVAFHPGKRYRRAVVAAVLLGAAIRGGYYTALAATSVIPNGRDALTPGLDPFALGLVTAAGSTIVLMFIAVAALGGLLQPRVAGQPKGTRAWVPRRSTTVGADSRTLPEPEILARPGAATAHAELTFEELSYVGGSFDGSIDDSVELLGLIDDYPPATAGGSQAAIDEVPAVDPGDNALFDDTPPVPFASALKPIPAMDALGRDSARRRERLVDEDSGELVAVLVPVARRPGTQPREPADTAGADRTTEADRQDGTDRTAAAAPAGDGQGRYRPSLNPSTFVWTAALPAGVPARPPAPFPALPGALDDRGPAARAGRVTPEAPAPGPWAISVPSGGQARSRTAADLSYDNAGMAPSGQAGDRLPGRGPRPRWSVPLWFPPPAWWFLTEPSVALSTAGQRPDDPSAPTRPLCLEPVRPPR